MNKDNAAQYLPLVQALAEGKVIQFRPDSNCPWRDRPQIDFSATIECYRIKPEPRKAYLLWRDGFAVPMPFLLLHEAEQSRSEWGGHITEVTE